MILVKADKNTEAGVMPSEQLHAAMIKFNEELAQAGVLLGCDGLQPSSKGARVKFSKDQRRVINGPFGEPRELICGFWIWNVKSIEEAIEWVKRCPNPTGAECEIEIRQMMEMDDFGPEMPATLKERATDLFNRLRHPAEG